MTTDQRSKTMKTKIQQDAQDLFDPGRRPGVPRRRRLPGLLARPPESPPPREVGSIGGRIGPAPEQGRMVAMNGTFHCRFESFADGIASLAEVSDSARQAIEAGRVAASNMYTGEPVLSDYGERAVPECPERVAMWLARNAWSPAAGGSLNLWIGKDRLSYTTTGGLCFSWWRIANDQWLFQVTHPKGEDIPEESSLRDSAVEHGWQLGEDRYAGSFDEGARP